MYILIRHDDIINKVNAANQYVPTDACYIVKKERTHNPTRGEAKSFPDERKALRPASYMEKGAEYTSYAMHSSGKPRNIP